MQDVENVVAAHRNLLIGSHLELMQAINEARLDAHDAGRGFPTGDDERIQVALSDLLTVVLFDGPFAAMLDDNERGMLHALDLTKDAE